MSTRDDEVADEVGDLGDVAAAEPPHLAAARRALLAEREAAAAQLAALTRDFAVMVEASQSVATDDEHDPEGATIAFERAQVAALRDDAVRHIGDLDHALQAIDGGTYGVCERCGEAIRPERLAVRPAARRCVTCAAVRGR
jgi:RNA polymerase-binding transcription factor DksA